MPEPNQIALQLLQVARLELFHLMLDREESHDGTL
jgi:hypothetical protein